MSDEPFYKPNLARAPLSAGQPGEPLYECTAGDRRFRFELRDHGDSGVECQTFRDGEFWSTFTSIRGSIGHDSRGTWRFSGQGHVAAAIPASSLTLEPPLDLLRDVICRRAPA